MRQINRIILHCSASNAISDVPTIRKFHMDPPPEGRGWKDIGYHWVITPKADIQKGRPEEEIGAHCENHNTDSLGVCLGGVKNFDEKQLEAMKWLMQSLFVKYSLDETNVYMHYELDQHGKTCPNLDGNLVRAYLKKIGEKK